MSSQSHIYLLCLVQLIVIISYVIPGYTPPLLQGNASAVGELLERKIPGASKDFVFTVDPDTCVESTCFKLSDASNGKVIAISGTRL